MAQATTGGQAVAAGSRDGNGGTGGGLAKGGSGPVGAARGGAARGAMPTFVRQNEGDAEALAQQEWILTNGLGGFAMGSVLGAMSRRYHGLLVASLRPPVQRVMTLSTLAETLVTDPDTASDTRYDLSCYRFRPGELHPQGYRQLVRFERDETVRWVYACGPVEVVKEVGLARDANVVTVRYRIAPAGKAVRLMVRPLVAMRDFHSLMLRDTSRGRFRVEATAGACAVEAGGQTLHIVSDAARFEATEQWWHNFQYDVERDRGYDYIEDLYHPGSFLFEAPAGHGMLTVTFSAALAAGPARDLDADAAAQRRRLEGLLAATRKGMGPAAAAAPSEALAALVAASDDYVVKRVPAQARTEDGPGEPTAAPSVTVIAGYPWFADWGRDSMISLPGLLLTTGRFDEARGVLLTFANHRAAGLVPNVFDDYTGSAHHNTVDASLWFIHACCQYLQATGDRTTFNKDLLPAALDIVQAYRTGTSFGIKMDEADALIMAGDPSTQLTWMDAKRDGVTFTPRHGKPVEINALWHHALVCLAEVVEAHQPVLGKQLRELAERVGESIRTKFWNAQRGCLHDCLSPGGWGRWEPQTEVRPNQIFAVSLRHSALSAEQKLAVVASVRDELLTPHGLRTLERGDWRYKGRYRGRMFDRDAAYHNGTAWPWLLGHYVEGVLRAGSFSREACAEARRAITPILGSLDRDCAGQLAEVYDGDDAPDSPQRPGGCPAQAWSVAEVLRALVLLSKAEAGATGL